MPLHTCLSACLSVSVSVPVPVCLCLLAYLSVCVRLLLLLPCLITLLLSPIETMSLMAINLHYCEMSGLTELLVFDENKLIVFPNPKTNTSLSSFNVSFNVISSCTMSGLFTPCTASLQFFFCSVFTRLSANVPQETTAMTLRLNSVQSRYLSLCEDYTMLGQSCSKTGQNRPIHNRPRFRHLHLFI